MDLSEEEILQLGRALGEQRCREWTAKFSWAYTDTPDPTYWIEQATKDVQRAVRVLDAAGEALAKENA